VRDRLKKFFTDARPYRSDLGMFRRTKACTAMQVTIASLSYTESHSEISVF